MPPKTPSKSPRKPRPRRPADIDITKIRRAPATQKLATTKKGAAELRAALRPSKSQRIKTELGVKRMLKAKGSAKKCTAKKEARAAVTAIAKAESKLREAKANANRRVGLAKAQEKCVPRAKTSYALFTKAHFNKEYNKDGDFAAASKRVAAMWGKYQNKAKFEKKAKQDLARAAEARKVQKAKREPFLTEQQIMVRSEVKKLKKETSGKLTRKKMNDILTQASKTVSKAATAKKATGKKGTAKKGTGKKDTANKAPANKAPAKKSVNKAPIRRSGRKVGLTPGVNSTPADGRRSKGTKKFKPGDLWSRDFDIDGMLQYALTVNEKTPLKTLIAFQNSKEDAEYYDGGENLETAISWLRTGDVKKAKKFFQLFHEDMEDAIRNRNYHR